MRYGEIRKNRDGLEFIILEKDTTRCDSKHIYYCIKFLESGYESSARSDSISRGCVKDGLSVSCCGVGKIGYANTRKNWKEYKIWENMLYRCYVESDKSYKYYGGIGVYVCERWHRFDLFLRDIPSIKGFNRDMFENGMLRLDKDLLSSSEKFYSPKTTIWVTDAINQEIRTIEQNYKHKKYAIFPDGHTELITNVTEFCKKYSLHRQNVNLCLKGKQASSKGFRFYKEQHKSTDYPDGDNDSQKE